MRRPWGLPLVPLYWLGTKLGRRQVKKLRGRVISVGSLSAGGAGKTPVVMALGELLGRRGVGVDVLSRGYGRGSDVVEEVDAAGTAAQFGDEPMVMARAGLRVFVGGDRFAAGTLAEEGGVRVHVLDDGFQHRRLWRDVDVVLVTLADVQDWLLPAGNLREPLSALGRADVVVVREEEEAALAGVTAGREVWVVRRELVVEDVGGMVAFCGIARPAGFFAMVPGVVGKVAFGDHHRYVGADFERLVRVAKAVGARGFVTTEKDAVKISEEFIGVLAEVGPVVVAGLRVSFLDEGRVWEFLRGRVGSE